MVRMCCGRNCSLKNKSLDRSVISRLVDENYKLFVFSLYIDYQCVVFTKCFLVM